MVEVDEAMSGEESTDMLDVEVYTRGTVTVVAARGEIDIVSVPLLKSAFEQAENVGAMVVADLSGVGFMGSAGLSALLVAVEGAKPHQLRVVVSSAVRRPIEVTGLDKMLALYDTLEAALSTS